MPLDHLHMTALEITHSRTAEEIDKIVKGILPCIGSITDYTYQHRASLIKPMLSYDEAAVALSFVPAAEEAYNWDSTAHAGHHYTYHHLRRDLYSLCREAGTVVDSRYSVPSSHVTIGRFITAEDHACLDERTGSWVPDRENMARWIDGIDRINAWLRAEYWPDDRNTVPKPGSQWVVGEEQGLDCRYGTLWYGGGTTIRIGQGF